MMNGISRRSFIGMLASAALPVQSKSLLDPLNKAVAERLLHEALQKNASATHLRLAKAAADNPTPETIAAVVADDIDGAAETLAFIEAGARYPESRSYKEWVQRNYLRALEEYAIATRQHTRNGPR